MSKKPAILFSILIFFALAAFMLDVVLGSVMLNIEEWKNLIFNGQSASAQNQWIVWEYRLPKAITAFLAGAALSISGLLLQSLFRNPLAGPYVLGISSGASLGVALVILAGFGFGGFLQYTSTLWAAWAGSALVLLILLSLSARVRDTMGLLVIGLMFSSFTSALVGLLQYFSKAEELQAYLLWTFGSMGRIPTEALPWFALLLLAGASVAWIFSPILDALLLGDRYAQNLGVNVRWARAGVIAVTSLLAGITTGYCGPIVFVGLAVPHLVRLFFGVTTHRLLIPASLLFGGAFLLICDVLAQMPGLVVTLPINVVTSLVGAPFVIWIIVRYQQQFKFF